MNRILLIVGLLVSALVGGTSARVPVAEGPSGASVCSNAVDDNLSTLVDAADSDCAAAAAFSAVGGGYAASTWVSSGPWVRISDPTHTLSGTYDHLPDGNDPRNGALKGTGVPAGTYYLWVRAYVVSGAKPTLWVQATASSTGVMPTHDVASQLPITPDYQWLALGAAGSPSNYKAGLQTEVQRTLTVATNDAIYVWATPDIRIDCLFVHTSADAVPVCPGGGTGVTTWFTIKRVASAPTSCADAIFTSGSPNVVTWRGYKTTAENDPTLKAVWLDGTPDRLYVCGIFPDNDLRNSAAGFSWSRDNLELNWRDSLVTTAPDATTYKTAMEVDGSLYQANWPNGTLDPAYIANLAGTAAITSTLDDTANDSQWTAFMAMDLGMTGSNGIQFLCDFARFDRDAASTYQIAYSTLAGGTSLPSTWGVCQLSSTLADPPTDSTAPVIGVPAVSAITGTSAVITSTMNEAGEGFTRYDTDSDSAVSGADMVPPTGQPSLACGPRNASNNIVCTLTGLSAGQFHEVFMRGQDLAGNVGNSSVVNFTTSAAGTTFYVRTGGNDANNCTDSTTNACLTIARAHTVATTPSTIDVGPGVFEFSQVTLSKSNIVYQGQKTGSTYDTILDAPVYTATTWAASTDSDGTKTLQASDGVFKSTLGYQPGAITVLDGGQYKYLLRVHNNIMNATSNNNIGGRTGFQDLARAQADTISDKYSAIQIPYWPMVKGMWGYRGTAAYLRFDDKTDPDAKTIRVAPSATPKVILSGSNNTFKRFRIRTTSDAIRVTGHGNVIEDNYLEADRTRLEISGSASANIIRSNTFIRNTLSTQVHGANSYYNAAYSAGSPEYLAYAQKERMHALYKYTAGDSATLDYGVFVATTASGSNNQIHTNLFEELGIAANLGPNTNLRAYDNRFYRVNSVGGPGTGTGVATNFQFYNNEMIDCNQIRITMHIGGSTMYFYRNKTWQPANIGDTWYFTRLDGLPDTTNIPNPNYVWLYHNSVSGGRAGVTSWSLTKSNILSRTFVLNNIFSSPDPALSDSTGTIGAFNYNWLGGDGTSINGAQQNIVATGTYQFGGMGAEPGSWNPTGSALNAGLDLSGTFIIGGTSYPALPGMTGSAGTIDVGAIDMP